MMARTRGIRRWRRVAVGVLLVVGIAGALAGVGLATLPDVADLARHDPSTTAFIERDRANGAKVRWRIVPYDQISDQLKLAVVVAEDIGFFNHHGFDTHEMATAAREAIEGKRLRGASTITQQLAKNLWLSPSKTATRKLREAVLTWQLERHLSKRRILELYLNVVEFGPGAYGADAAAGDFFDIQPSELDAHQAAQLAAGLSRPSLWNPRSTREAYARHVERILGRMSRAEWIKESL